MQCIMSNTVVCVICCVQRAYMQSVENNYFINVINNNKYTKSTWFSYFMCVQCVQYCRVIPCANEAVGNRFVAKWLSLSLHIYP